MKKTIDLRSDNRIGSLLEEYEAAVAAFKEAEELKKELESEIREKVGDAEEAIVDDWIVRFNTIDRKEFTVRATTYRRLKVSRRITKRVKVGNVTGSSVTDNNAKIRKLIE